MLKNTFLHLPGIGIKKERELWNTGILTWDDFEKAFLPQWRLFEDGRDKDWSSILKASREALSEGDIDFFAELLPKREHYRIALTVPEQTAFLDIETTGLSHHYDKITVIGCSLGDEYWAYIKGTNKKALKKSLSKAKCLVTFNGTIFDLKFIEKEFPEITLPRSHVDLRFFARRAGFSGGQKAIEKTLGIQRAAGVKEMTGEQAPLLWHHYRMGGAKAGRTLIEYNHADVEGMKIIFDAVVERLNEKESLTQSFGITHRFSNHQIPLQFARDKKTATKNRIYVPRFIGKHGPLITYKELASDPRTKDLRVVGIDLTGSEARASGWAVMERDQADTKMLNTDAELLVETINAQPDLVSIDSPLSLPEGRKWVTDDDPGRDKFGIMRKCERILKSRGVNVYPSLIPSMQRLTERGIRLASHFRALGIPVIESYPGAAQDIMDIPRKRAGLEHLVTGLADFGLVGDFARNGASHDELDAITSAIVGLFFWSGKFEALGNEEEDYLIIPDLERSPKEWLKRVVVGFSGPIFAGKTTGASYLEDRGFAYGRFSQVLERELKKKRQRVTRKSLQEFGAKVNKEYGQRWLAKKLVAPLAPNQKIAIDGLRFPEDHAHLVEAYGPAFVHIHVEASEAIRKKRYIKGNKSAAEFEKAAAHPVESKVNVLAPLANFVVPNEGSIEAFTRRIRSAISAKDI